MKKHPRTLVASSPRGADPVGRIRGLRQGDRLVGIDIRPANGKICGVGRAGGPYTLNARTARATRVGALSVDLGGRYFGVDVDPAADTPLNGRAAGNIGDATLPLGQRSALDQVDLAVVSG